MPDPSVMGGNYFEFLPSGKAERSLDRGVGGKTQNRGYARYLVPRAKTTSTTTMEQLLTLL